METLLVYSLLTSALFYLGSRAVITRPLWSRYPAWLASFMDCAACSGFWYGFILSLPQAIVKSSQFLRGAPGILGSEWYSPILIGLCSIVWTPIVSGYMQLGFERLGSIVGTEEAPQQEP